MVIRSKTEKQCITFYVYNEYIDNIVYNCDSEIIEETDTTLVVKKSNFVKRGNIDDVTPINGENTFVIITYSKKKDYDKFLTGYIYFENKENEMNNFVSFASKQVGNWCHDNIGVCYLENNIFL